MTRTQASASGRTRAASDEAGTAAEDRVIGCRDQDIDSKLRADRRHQRA
jgi:hypothetical protein